MKLGNIEFRISENNENVIIFSKNNKTYPIAIPTTSAHRVDFIDQDFNYHYNYKKNIHYGFKIKIENCKMGVEFVDNRKLKEAYYSI